MLTFLRRARQHEFLQRGSNAFAQSGPVLQAEPLEGARRGEPLYNFSNSASCFGSVTGALQVKFSQAYVADYAKAKTSRGTVLDGRPSS